MALLDGLVLLIALARLGLLASWALLDRLVLLILLDRPVLLIALARLGLLGLLGLLARLVLLIPLRPGLAGPRKARLAVLTRLAQPGLAGWAPQGHGPVGPAGLGPDPHLERFWFGGALEAPLLII